MTEKDKSTSEAELSETKELKTVKGTSAAKKRTSSTSRKTTAAAKKSSSVGKTAAMKKISDESVENKETKKDAEEKKKEEPKKVETALKSKPKKIKVRKRPNRLGFNWFFWISAIVLMIPVCYFGYLLFQASQESNTPVIGERINNDIETKITEEQISSIKTQVLALSGIEKCEVNLIVETMRVNVDVDDSYDAAKMKELNKSIYDIVDSVLPVASYFTSHYEWKQYDLEINSYTNLDSDDCIIVILNKNARMEQYNNQVVSSPLNEKLAEELYQKVIDQTKAEEEAKERKDAEAAPRQRGQDSMKESNELQPASVEET